MAEALKVLVSHWIVFSCREHLPKTYICYQLADGAQSKYMIQSDWHLLMHALLLENLEKRLTTSPTSRDSLTIVCTVIMSSETPVWQHGTVEWWFYLQCVGFFVGAMNGREVELYFFLYRQCSYFKLWLLSQLCHIIFAIAALHIVVFWSQQYNYIIVPGKCSLVPSAQTSNIEGGRLHRGGAWMVKLSLCKHPS